MQKEEQEEQEAQRPRNRMQGSIPRSNKYDHMFKIIIIGDPCCGKTSLLLRATQNIKNEKYSMTVGVDCKSKMVYKDEKLIKLQIWDTAGQEKFRTLTTSYYRGTSCCVLVFDITNIKSFYNLYQWIDQYNYHCDQPIKNIIITANKIDLEHQRQVSELEISKFCDSMNCYFTEVSVLLDRGIDELFDMVVDCCMELHDHIAISMPKEVK